MTKQPELKKLPSGTSVVKFALATNHIYKNQAGEKVETTQFHNCVAFGKVAETKGTYVVKGQELFVAGRIEYRSWDKKDGTKAYATEIMVEIMQFGAKAKGTGEGGTNTQSAPAKSALDEFDGPDDATDPEEEDIDPADIPF